MRLISLVCTRLLLGEMVNMNMETWCALQIPTLTQDQWMSQKQWHKILCSEKKQMNRFLCCYPVFNKSLASLSIVFQVRSFQVIVSLLTYFTPALSNVNGSRHKGNSCGSRRRARHDWKSFVFDILLRGYDDGALRVLESYMNFIWWNYRAYKWSGV